MISPVTLSDLQSSDQHGSLPRYLHPGMIEEHSVTFQLACFRNYLGYSVEVETSPIIQKDTKEQHFKCKYMYEEGYKRQD